MSAPQPWDRLDCVFFAQVADTAEVVRDARALERRQPLRRDPERVRHREAYALHAEIDGQNPRGQARSLPIYHTPVGVSGTRQTVLASGFLGSLGRLALS